MRGGLTTETLSALAQQEHSATTVLTGLNDRDWHPVPAQRAGSVGTVLALDPSQAPPSPARRQAQEGNKRTLYGQWPSQANSEPNHRQLALLCGFRFSAAIRCLAATAVRRPLPVAPQILIAPRRHCLKRDHSSSPRTASLTAPIVRPPIPPPTRTCTRVHTKGPLLRTHTRQQTSRRNAIITAHTPHEAPGCAVA